MTVLYRCMERCGAVTALCVLSGVVCALPHLLDSGDGELARIDLVRVRVRVRVWVRLGTRVRLGVRLGVIAGREQA